MKTLFKKEPLVAAIIVMFVLVMLFCIIYALVTGFWNDPEPAYYITYIVQPYDTLWGIASLSDGYGVIDTRIIITHMEKTSDITSTIYPHQIVYVPMYSK